MTVGMAQVANLTPGSANPTHGLTPDEAYERFYVVDKSGLVTSARELKDGAPGVNDLRPFASSRKNVTTTEGMKLADVVRLAKPTVGLYTLS